MFLAPSQEREKDTCFGAPVSSISRNDNHKKVKRNPRLTKIRMIEILKHLGPKKGIVGCCYSTSLDGRHKPSKFPIEETESNHKPIKQYN